MTDFSNTPDPMEEEKKESAPAAGFYNTSEPDAPTQGIPATPSPVSDGPIDPIAATDERPVRATNNDTYHTFSRLGLGLLLLTVGTYVGQLALQGILEGFGYSMLTHWWVQWVLSLVPLYCCGLPLMYIGLRAAPVTPLNRYFVPLHLRAYSDTYEKPRFTVGQFFILLFLGFGCMYIGNIIGSTLMSILSAITGHDYQSGLESMVSESPMWMTFLGTCICAPIGEELLFRKLLIDRARRFGDAPAILLSGFFFGIFHGNFFQFFYAFLIGIILAYIYTRTGKLWICSLMHAIVNLFGGIIMPELAGLLPTDPTESLTRLQSYVNLFLAVWIYGLIILAIVLTITRWKRMVLSKGSTPLPEQNAVKNMLLNPGMIAAFVVMALLMALSLLPL